MTGNNQQMQNKTNEDHKRQSFWQIYFPLMLAVALVVIAAIVLLGKQSQGSENLRIWADISIILMILPLFLLTLILIILTILGSAGTYKASGSLKNGFQKLGQLISNLSHIVLSVFNAIRKLLIDIEVFSSVISGRTFK